MKEPGRMFGLFRPEQKWARWSKTASSEADRLESFLKAREYSAVPFTSRMIEAGGPSDTAICSRNTVFTEKTSNRIISALLLSADGIVCPVFSEESSTAGLRTLTGSNLFSRKRYITVMGTSDDVLEIEKLFPERKKTSVDYHLMTAASSSVPNVVEKHIALKSRDFLDSFFYAKADINDLDFLMPLRKAYELEEVVLNKAHFNEEACRRRFSRTITSGAVFFASETGKAAATCCINAEGFNWAQIGGVYTEPALRSRGLSARLMSELARFTDSKHKDLTLFAKKNNIAALKLYSNCGFKKRGGYRISYLESR